MELNEKRASNMIMLGAQIKVTELVSKESVIKAIVDTVNIKYKDVNIQAFHKGYELL